MGIVQDAQGQGISSATVTLWEVETATDTYAFFHDGFADDGGSVTVKFRNRITPSSINSYVSLPIEGDGFEWKSEGPSTRPTLKVANILSAFSGQLGNLTNKDLIGSKVYRRSTLFKYTHDHTPSAGSANPPIEFPMQLYIIDRIKQETPLYITFELASGYDLEGVKLPRRVITGTSCPWIYTGARPELAEKDKIGGCTWSNTGQVRLTIPSSGGTDIDTHFVNGSDEPVVISTAVIGAHTTTGAVVKGGIYHTSTVPTMYRVTPEGISETPAGDNITKDYWQYMGESVTGSPTPTDNNKEWRRVRIYSAAYSASNTYNVYSLSLYNSYVKHSSKLWRATNVSQENNKVKAAPGFNNYWELGDVCSKSIEGCALRYRYKATTSSGQTVVDPEKSSQPLQFGAFPGSRTFS